MIYGYARVSTVAQDLASQLAQLTAADNRLKELRDIMLRRNLQARVTFFGVVLPVPNTPLFHRLRMLRWSGCLLISSQTSRMRIANSS